MLNGNNEASCKARETARSAQSVIEARFKKSVVEIKKFPYIKPNEEEKLAWQNNQTLKKFSVRQKNKKPPHI